MMYDAAPKMDGHVAGGSYVHMKPQMEARAMYQAQNIAFDGKRLRKAVIRRTVDYIPSTIRHIQDRVWQRDKRDMPLIQPDEQELIKLVPPSALLHTPMNAIPSSFVKSCVNKFRCPVNVVKWTPEGRRLITGASSGEFTLWNGTTFNFETISQAHDTPIRAMRWSHNEIYLLSSDQTGLVKYFQSNLNCIQQVQAHRDPVRTLAFSPTDVKFVTGSDDGTLKLFDLNSAREERSLTGHGWDVRCVDWHPNKALVASGSKDSTVRLWDPKSGTCITTLHAHKSVVTALQFNTLSDHWLATASRDQLCKVYDIRMLRQEQRICRGHKKEATSLAWHPHHASLFASGGNDGAILFFLNDAAKDDDALVATIPNAHESAVWSLDWHPLGHLLCSGSNDQMTKFWTRTRPGDAMRDKYNLNLDVNDLFDEVAHQDDDQEDGGSHPQQHHGKKSSRGFIPGLGGQVPSSSRKPGTDDNINADSKRPRLDDDVGRQERAYSNQRVNPPAPPGMGGNYQLPPPPPGMGMHYQQPPPPPGMGRYIPPPPPPPPSSSYAYQNHPPQPPRESGNHRHRDYAYRDERR